MNNSRKLLSFILLTWAEINAANSSDTNSSKYDLTDVLNNVIVSILKGNHLVEKLESLIFIPAPHKTYNGVYKINNTKQLPPFGDSIDIHTVLVCGLSYTHDFPRNIRLFWKFSENKLCMFYSELKYMILGHVYLGKSRSYWDVSNEASQIHAYHHRYHNFSVIATKLSANQKDDKNITIDMTHDHARNYEGIQLDDSRKIPYEHQLKLLYLFGLELPSITRHVLNDGDNLRTSLGRMFDLHPKQRIIIAYPDFLANEQRYYYLIPDISFGYLYLKNITIKGLSNLESYVNHQTRPDRYSYSYTPVYTLHVRNVRGNMILDPGFDHLPRFQLSFSIPNLYISFVPKNESFCVEARDYFIVEDTAKAPTLISSWLSKYSTNIMQVIESAMEDLMMPSKKNTEKSISLTPHLPEIETSFVELLKKSAI